MICGGWTGAYATKRDAVLIIAVYAAVLAFGLWVWLEVRT